MKAKNGAANIAVRTYLKVSFKLYRCYKVASEWRFKPFLNLKNARRFVISELCKLLAPSTLFASASLSKKQKRKQKTHRKHKSPTCTQQMRDDGWKPLNRFEEQEKGAELCSNIIATSKFWIIQSRCQCKSCKDNLEDFAIFGFFEVAYWEPKINCTLMQNVDLLFCTRLQSGSCHFAASLQLDLQLILQAELSNPLGDGLC